MATPLTSSEVKTMNHLEYMEDWKSIGYVPSKRSGVTIGYGIDLSQPPYNTAEGLRQNGFSEEFIAKAVELDVLGKDAVALGGQAKARKLATQLTVPNTKAEKERQFRLIQTNIDDRASKYAGKMDENAFISYKTLNHWSGGGMSKAKRDKITEKDLKNGIKNPYDRKAYVAGVIEDELDRIYQEKGYITEEEYQAAILKGKNSVPKFEKNSPKNTTTLNRELKFVQKNSGKTVTNESYENILNPAYEVTQEEAERVYGPSARINNVNGKDVIVYTDDFGDPQQVDANTVTKESPDYEQMPMVGEIEVRPTPERVTPITPDIQERQDNTRVVTPPPPVADDLIVNESDADRRKREKLQEEDERRNLRAREREEDAKRYMELTRKKKEAVEYYGKEGKRAKRFDEELAEIEKKYNLTPMRSDEDLEKIRLETINQILDDPEERGNVFTDQDLVDIEEEEPNVEDNFLVTEPNTTDTDAPPVVTTAETTDEEQTTTDTREPTVEEIETRHGPNASINDLNGVPHVVYTDENGDPQQYAISEFYSEDNIQRYELYDNGTLLPLQNTPITDDDLIARQDNTRVSNIPPIELQEGEGEEGGEDVEAIDPTLIPNEQTSLVTSANDIDGDTVPDLLDPDSQTVEVVNTDFANINNNQNNNQTNYLDTLGDLGKTLSQGLGLVQDVRDMIGNPDDLMMSALGKKAYAEAMKEIKPADYPELSAQFKDHLNQTRQLAKMGFSLDESQKIKSDIDAAYGKGIENAVRGTAGDRAKFLAMSGVLDSQRQSALLDFAAKDAALQRQNQGQYLKALSFSEEYELNKTKAERAEELQLTLQQKKGASEFAKTVFSQISQNNANKRLAPVLNRYKNELLSGMSGGGSPYSLTTPNITTGK